MSGVNIRRLVKRDIPRAKSIIERSVRKLCYIDHGNDEPTIRLWLDAAYPGLYTDYVIVGHAQDEKYITGVAAMCKEGAVFLNYVDPDSTAKSVSSYMMAHLQLIALDLGLRELFLVSTASARQYYRKFGWKEWQAPSKGNGVSWNHHMKKKIQ